MGIIGIITVIIISATRTCGMFVPVP